MKNKPTYDFKGWRETFKCNISIAKYYYDNSLAISLEDADTGEPICTLTVCLALEDFGIYDKGLCYLDTNNNPFAEEFIVTNKLGKPLIDKKGEKFYAHSGYWFYPLYKMDMELLRSVCVRNNYD